MGFNLRMTLLFLSMLISFLSQTPTEAAPIIFNHICTNTTTLTANSNYQSNLLRLLASLSSKATSNLEFYNASTGNSVDTVYGLFMCRGDLPAADCQECVAAATKEIVERCTDEKVAVAWYAQCLLRYSNLYIFSTMVLEPTSSISSTQTVSESNRFDELVMATMNDLASSVSNVSSGDKKFATKEANFTASQTIYTLVQCTPDLSGSDCNRCLQIAIKNLPSCCAGKKMGGVLFPSCYLRYGMYPFYLKVNTSAPRSNPAPVPPPLSSGKGQNSLPAIIAIVASISVSVILFVMGYCFLRRRARKKYNAIQEGASNDITTIESLQFGLATIKVATNNFSHDNKLGVGGFGAVYKGILSNGQEIAVKRLSKKSGQGVGEFKNEVVVVAKLQHRNLVRLLGFCLEREEKILVYEFVENKSLDYFLYDVERQRQLDWPTRYKIIKGVARGIIYLHEDSRLKIIHRDLKASNVLLDGDMNPKVSDFGMAKIFGIDQTRGNTRRIAGTLGYMAPEYAMHGNFSVKSDVYSFGVLILEIISGRRISSFNQSDGTARHLLSHAWKLWRDGSPLDLLDPTLGDSYSRDEVIKCLHIGLLAVQNDPVDRPTIESIILMLQSYSVPLPSPQEPAYFFSSVGEQNMESNERESNQSKSKSLPMSVDEASITDVYPR
ncbi:cysteine-rich receptor-like protein kinase 10 isoform X2 [Corylus avellana]|uniref:cysteine-rich receptor-like protein kinase 10 isoform X2 n=1 Tax=Corylus avellana TaxID=13451 RepID=UPI00286C33C7|nr:cysteine-rich receptor-like protein kinase 10 isoform X2 [Corylus avellana]